MNELTVKSRVRERDGYKCRDCGMTNEEHNQKYGKCLNVHRIVPGSGYTEYWCVTLCHECHRVKPRKADQLVFSYNRSPLEDGAYMIWMNLYNPEDREVYERLLADADGEERHVSGVAVQILKHHYRLDEHDYVI